MPSLSSSLSSLARPRSHDFAECVAPRPRADPVDTGREKHQPLTRIENRRLRHLFMWLGPLQTVHFPVDTA